MVECVLRYISLHSAVVMEENITFYPQNVEYKERYRGIASQTVFLLGITCFGVFVPDFWQPLKALPFGNCQRPVSSLGASQH